MFKFAALIAAAAIYAPFAMAMLSQANQMIA